MICSAYRSGLGIFYYLLTWQAAEYFLRIRRAGGRLRGRSFYLAVRKRHPQGSVWMGDADEVSEPFRFDVFPYEGRRFNAVFFCAFSSDGRNDVSHQVCIDPADRACINASDLEQRWHLWVACSSVLVEDIAHPPGLLFCHHHGHAWFDPQEKRFLIGVSGASRPMVFRHLLLPPMRVPQAVSTLGSAVTTTTTTVLLPYRSGGASL